MTELMNEPSPADQNRGDLARIMSWLLACYSQEEIAEAAGCGKAVTQANPGEKVGAKVPAKMPEPLEDRDLPVDHEPLPAFLPEVVSSAGGRLLAWPPTPKPQLRELVPQGADRSVPARMPGPVSSAGESREKAGANLTARMPEGDPSEEDVADEGRAFLPHLD